VSPYGVHNCYLYYFLLLYYLLISIVYIYQSKEKTQIKEQTPLTPHRLPLWLSVPVSSITNEWLMSVDMQERIKKLKKKSVESSLTEPYI